METRGLEPVPDSERTGRVRTLLRLARRRRAAAVLHLVGVPRLRIQPAVGVNAAISLLLGGGC